MLPGQPEELVPRPLPKQNQVSADEPEVTHSPGDPGDPAPGHPHQPSATPVVSGLLQLLGNFKVKLAVTF